MEKVELVTAVVVDDDGGGAEQEEGATEEDTEPLLEAEGGRRRSTRIIYDNSRLDVKTRTRSRCSVQQICLSLLGLITTSAVLFILLAGSREQPSRRTLAPGIDFMDFKQPKNMISYQVNGETNLFNLPKKLKEILEDNFSFNLSSSGDVMVFLHIQKTGGTTFGGWPSWGEC
jgi:hypothetical protein